MRFLGSITFTLILIGMTALFAAASTWIESATDSHLLASQFTTSNPVFTLLLGGYFLNILISALRRWPFKCKHIPFLMTHLGLLMLLTGVFVKHFFGLQGSVYLAEGSSSNKLLLPNTFAIEVRDREKTTSWPLDAVKIRAYSPHGKATLEPILPAEIQKQEGMLVATDRMGQSARSPFPTEKLYVYEEGFGGYAAPATFAFPDYASPLVKGTLWYCYLQRDPHKLTAWPLPIEDNQSVLEQLIAVADQLPYPPELITDDELAPYRPHLPEHTYAWEVPLYHSLEPLEPILKKEEQTPLITIDHDGSIVSLIYDKLGGMWWPNKTGTAMFRFTSDHLDLPFRVRLKQARKLSDPTGRPLSYEADVSIDERPVTLSMNRVHELSDGTRLYLSSISPGTPDALQFVQIVVNRDPAKYWLTYPGGMCVALGIIGLLGLRPLFAVLPLLLGSWVHIPGRFDLNTPLYTLEVPAGWTEEIQSADRQDTTLPLAAWNKEGVRLVFSNFPPDQIPIDAQIQRWKQQLPTLHASDWNTKSVHWSGYIGVEFFAQSPQQAILGWVLELAPYHKQHLHPLAHVGSDIIFKATGTPEAVQALLPEIRTLVHSFETVTPFPIK